MRWKTTSCWLAVTLSIGCSQPISHGPDSSVGDAALDSSASDASADALPSLDAARPSDASPALDVRDAMTARCDPAAPFGAPTLVAGVNSGSGDEAASLSADERTIWFGSWRAEAVGGDDIYTASRENADAVFGIPVRVDVLSSSYEDGIPQLSRDGTTMVLTSTRAAPSGGGLYDVWLAVRTSPVSGFEPPSFVASVSTDGVDGSGTLSEAPGDEALYYAQSPLGVVAADLMRAAGTPDTGFGTPVPLTSVNSPSNDTDPVLSADALTLFFASERAGGLGALDVWVATRGNTSESFAGATPVTSVNSAQVDRPSWVSPDGCRLYLTSDRTGSAMNDIYVATRE
ncbi:MAG: hypothetical protein K1X94_24265 [Sandaracinaceae bacterium]|nr:hypothetical protein [Sandaracinaceae bacterium]